MTKVPDITSIAAVLKNVPYAASAVDLLKASAGIDPDAEFHGNDKFRALCEAVVFDEVSKRPFFEVIGNLHPSEILYEIRNHNITLPKRLTYNELYILLRSFRGSERRNLLERLPITAKAFNEILTSLESDDFYSFSDAINNCDSTEWLEWLTVLQYIRYGSLKSKPYRSLRNTWLSGLGFRDYFRDSSDPAVKAFLDRERMKWSGAYTEQKIRRRSGETLSIAHIQKAMESYSTLFCSSCDLWEASYSRQWIESDTILENATLTAHAIFKNEFDNNHRNLSLSEDERSDWPDYLESLECITSVS